MGFQFINDPIDHWVRHTFIDEIGSDALGDFRESVSHVTDAFECLIWGKAKILCEFFPISTADLGDPGVRPNFHGHRRLSGLDLLWVG